MARSWALVTRTVMLVVQMGASGRPRWEPRFERPIRNLFTLDPHLWVYDKATGEKLADIALPSNATGAPITYMAGGKQFVAFPVGGGGLPEELIAVALP
jgi:quinoprotein glucose dehydrogenase